MRALITGIAGFAGSYLAKELLESGYQVYGTKLKGESNKNLRGFSSSLSISELDLRDQRAVRRYIGRIKPELVVHLAAVSSVGLSFREPRMTLEVNLLGTVNLLDALRSTWKPAKVLVISSSDVYGIIKSSDLPIKETAPMVPVTPYGVSKAATDMVGYQYFKSFGMPIVRVRAFNHTGPKQSAGFVVPDFCRQVALIESGQSKPVLRVGNLEAERDISDVRDIVHGYRLIAEKGRLGDVYNLCSGKCYRIKDILHRILGMATEKIELVSNPELMRPSEVPRLVGDFSKVRRAVGFRPKHKLIVTLEETLNYWRSAVRRTRS